MDARVLAIRELAELIGQSNAHARSFLQLLNDERGALASGDVSAIDHHGQRKAELIDLLERLDTDRSALADAAGISAANYDTEFTRYDASNLAAPGWAALLDTLRACHEANAVNGQIAAQRRRHVEQALGILHGTGAADGAVYGPDGMSATPDAAEIARA